MEFLFIVLILVVWRITHLISSEDGPFDVIFHLRRKAGAGFFGSLLDCFYCLSLWVALPFGLYTGHTWKEKILYWLYQVPPAWLNRQPLNQKIKRRTNQIIMKTKTKTYV